MLNAVHKQRELRQKSSPRASDSPQRTYYHIPGCPLSADEVPGKLYTSEKHIIHFASTNPSMGSPSHIVYVYIFYIVLVMQCDQPSISKDEEEESELHLKHTRVCLCICLVLCAQHMN